ncbi:MAG: outer membrane beta-barrel protein [Bacteroidota bacterium]|nr:outer membrane beta-barrel protein [Bacteroidota bacterium]
MKKTSFIAVALFIAAFATLNPTTANAQKAKGQVVVTGGVGYSLVGILLNAIQDGANTSGDVKSTKTPVIFGSADYGITDRFSVGACYTYQGISVKYSSYTTTDTAGNNVTIVGDFSDRLTRQSIGIRPLFHFGDSEDLDLFVGARFSYVFWNYNSSRDNFDSSDLLSGFGSPIKPQFLLGMRYFFVPTVGFNAEFAIGPTYFMAFGISARFGGM